MKIVHFQTQKSERLLRKTRKVTYYVPANFAIFTTMSGIYFSLKIKRMTFEIKLKHDFRPKMHETKFNDHFKTPTAKSRNKSSLIQLAECKP